MKQKTDMIQKMTVGGKLLKLPLKAAQNTPQKASNWSNNAKEMRKNLLQYFNSNEGSVDWQQKMI